MAGLVTGQDIIAQLVGKDLPDTLFVPRVMLRDNTFLDDVTIDGLAAGLFRPVVVVEPDPIALAAALRTSEP